MTEILELRVIDGQTWVRIPPLEEGESVQLWTDTDRKAAFRREREACMDAMIRDAAERHA